jgi:NAD(P)H-dependent FMN reductase
MAEHLAKKIAVITGSTRAKRVGPRVTKFVMGILETQLASVEGSSFSLSLIDLADFKLPVFDEQVIPAAVPAYAHFAHEHSKVWSAALAPYDGYVLVTASYNGGPPGAIKNAINCLYNEWTTKPIMIISYGIQGGKTASDALKTTLEVQQLKVVETRPMLAFPTLGHTPPHTAPWVQSALQGLLADECLEAWAAQKDEISKGFNELKELVITHKKV